MTARTGLLDREKALLHAYLALPITRGTGNGLRAGLGAGAFTGIARLHGWNLNARFRATGGFF
jgi:hypothetical protein